MMTRHTWNNSVLGLCPYLAVFKMQTRQHFKDGIGRSIREEPTEIDLVEKQLRCIDRVAKTSLVSTGFS
jgi:hypothetical protein